VRNNWSITPIRSQRSAPGAGGRQHQRAAGDRVIAALPQQRGLAAGQNAGDQQHAALALPHVGQGGAERGQLLDAMHERHRRHHPSTTRFTCIGWKSA
jgi:hypothetical protein